MNNEFNCFIKLFIILNVISCTGESIKDQRQTITNNDLDSQNLQDYKKLEYEVIYDSIDCSDREELYSGFKLNNIDINKIKKEQWLIYNPNYDSIVTNLIYYGKSCIMIDKEGVVFFTIRDENLTILLNKKLKLDNKSLSLLSKKYPCSFKNAGVDFLDKYECKSFEVFDINFNKLRFYFKGNMLLAISFFADEELPFE